jgi:hypothetical protein
VFWTALLPALWAGAMASPAARAVAAETAVPAAVSFSRDVVPALTKAGCNAGACHGSFQGRGGFRLSLWGFDPAADYEALTKEARGRRVSLGAPLQSLVLRKPGGELPHGGGHVLPRDSEPFDLLHRWIAAGAPPPARTEPTIVKLDVEPRELILPTGKQVALRVTAAWSDGVARDVTRWALYDVNDRAVAEVSRAGAVQALAPGRSAVTVRYLGRAAAVTVTVPYGPSSPAVAALPRHNFIDELAAAEWQKVGVEPAPLCDDATFLRRASLDLTGTLPTPEAVKAFLASPEPNKREKLIDSLLERPEYVDFWSLRWGDLLRAHRRTLGEKGLASFRNWLGTSIRDGRPANQMVRELLTAQGNLYANGAAAMFFVDQTPQDLAETTAQIFLGLRLQCARCHHHPFESISQDDYYSLAAFFAKVRRKDSLEGGRFGGLQAVLVDEAGAVAHPVTGAPVPPRVLGGKAQAAVPADARQMLAEWVTAADNPYFAKNIVNRYWAFLFGRGLVHPVDDLRDTNPATHPALLDAVAQDFIKHGYDLKHLLRTICRSRVYQLAAETAPKRDVAGAFLTHHVPRRLSAEVLLDAVNHAAGTSETFANLPPDTRAIALPDTSVPSEFLDIFGRPKRTTTCACERRGDPDLRQTLHLANSEALHQKIGHASGRIAKLLAAKRSDDEIIEELYLVALARLPGAAEKQTAQKFLAETPPKKEVFEDLLWTLVNCAEFSFSR